MASSDKPGRLAVLLAMAMFVLVVDTFISDVSTTSTNIAIASSTARRVSPLDSCAGTAASATRTSLLWATVELTR